MKVHTISGLLPASLVEACDMQRLAAGVERFCPPGCVPLRLSLIERGKEGWNCEVEGIQGDETHPLPEMPSIFSFRRRRCERSQAFNAVFLVPTGIDCAIGGHAGDATPAARLLASVCDHLILHPNVVNASDVNEQAQNCLYVEGSFICSLLMGAISLRKVRRNRILVVAEAGDDPWTIDQVVNTAHAAHATFGASCTKIAVLQEGLAMTMGRAPSGRATGDISGLERIFAVLWEERGNYDAVALSTRITASTDMTALLQDYFRGEGLNPWGGIEAALTHSISLALNIPSAHAPMMPDTSERTLSFGRVDPRKAAEAISTSFMFCLFKGLHQAPAIIASPDGIYDPSIIAVEDISCLVIPDGCIGLPTLAALQQGIPVIVVRDNTNLMKNDLQQLPFASGQLHVVDNYLEAAGLLSALKAGIHPASVTRPLTNTPVVTI